MSVQAPPVLIVEEDSYIQSQFNTVLKRRGFDNLHYVNGGEGALAITSSLKPALIICSLEMSDIDGLSFLSMIRGADQPEIQQTPVILVADKADPESVIKARKLKATGFLPKPVSVGNLEKHVLKLFGRKVH